MRRSGFSQKYVRAFCCVEPSGMRPPPRRRQVIPPNQNATNLRSSSVSEGKGRAPRVRPRALLEIGQRPFDRPAQAAHDRGDPLAIDRRRARPRVDTRLPQRFDRLDVADAGEHGLIHQHFFDRALFPPRELLREPRGVDAVEQRIGTESRPRREVVARRRNVRRTCSTSGSSGISPTSCAEARASGGATLHFLRCRLWCPRHEHVFRAGRNRSRI